MMKQKFFKYIYVGEHGELHIALTTSDGVEKEYPEHFIFLEELDVEAEMEDEWLTKCSEKCLRLQKLKKGKYLEEVGE